jgi:catechol 2,3-dioxygenase-like lactoylglutathione lyase family enzyme
MRSPGVHHTGITVSDLDRSIEFYGRLGFEPDEVLIEEGEEVERGVGVPGAKLRSTILLGPSGSRLELIQYLEPAGAPSAHPNNGIGAAHICLEVEDVDAAVAELREHGVEFLTDPITHEAGIRWVYAKDPDGVTAELLQVLE